MGRRLAPQRKILQHLPGVLHIETAPQQIHRVAGKHRDQQALPNALQLLALNRHADVRLQAAGDRTGKREGRRDSFDQFEKWRGRHGLRAGDPNPTEHTVSLSLRGS